MVLGASGSFAATAVLVVAAPGLLVFVSGWLAIRARVNGDLSIIAQAMTAADAGVPRQRQAFGGNKGLTDFKDLLGGAGPRHLPAAIRGRVPVGLRCRKPHALSWLSGRA